MKLGDQGGSKARWILVIGALVALLVGGATALAGGKGDKPLTAKQIVKLVKKQAKKNPGPAGPQGPAGPAGPSTITKFNCKTDEGVGDPSCGTLYDANGLLVTASCNPHGFNARTTISHAVATLETTAAGGASFGSISDSTGTGGFELGPAVGVAKSGTMTYTPPNSATMVRIEYSATYVPGAPQADCVFMGTITVL